MIFAVAKSNLYSLHVDYVSTEHASPIRVQHIGSIEISLVDWLIHCWFFSSKCSTKLSAEGKWEQVV